MCIRGYLTYFVSDASPLWEVDRKLRIAALAHMWYIYIDVYICDIHS